MKLTEHLKGHVDDTTNPHVVTQTQVGLSEVDNTSDADKPVSTDGQAALDAKLDLTNPSQTVTGDLTVTGDVHISGDLTVVDTETIQVSDNKIVLNYGETGDGVTAGTAGIVIDRGTAPDYYFQFDEVDDSFKVGKAESLLKVALREDVPTDKGVAIWDAASKKFITDTSLTLDSVDIAGSIYVGGDINVAGTVDGRAVAVDGDKLDGIDTGAKDDQTGSEIKALYEAEANTNAYTDDEKSKLGSIEDNATSDQTDAEIKIAYENNADTNAYTDSEKSKLDGIEANATVDQTKEEINALGIDAALLDGEDGDDMMAAYLSASAAG